MFVGNTSIFSPQIGTLIESAYYWVGEASIAQEDSIWEGQDTGEGAEGEADIQKALFVGNYEAAVQACLAVSLNLK